jgi:hypothetical protein
MSTLCYYIVRNTVRYTGQLVVLGWGDVMGSMCSYIKEGKGSMQTFGVASSSKGVT